MKVFKVVPSNSPFRIVMVDDDRDDIFLMKMILKRAEFNVKLVGFDNGDDFFNHIKNNGIGSVDLLLLDVNLPIQYSQDILVRLGAYPSFSDMNIVMLSTSSRVLDRAVFKKLGVSNFLVKPASSHERASFIQMFSKILEFCKLA